MKIRSALIIASGMLAGIILISLSAHAPAAFRMSAVPTAQKAVYDLPQTSDSTLEARVVSRYRMMAENGILAAYAAQAAFAQAQATLDAQAAAASARATEHAASAAVPPSWQATATCEEGGRDDANYGYFGIQEWNGFGGYAKAGDAPLSVQLAWEAAHGQGPPDAPGQCHGY